MRVRLTPNSSSCGIRGIFVDADGLEYLKINVVAVPEKGKANRELIKFLAGRLKLSKSEIRIAGGETDRCKKLQLPLSENVRQTLLQLSEEGYHVCTVN